MSELQPSCNPAPNEPILFKVKYRSATKTFRIPKDMPMDEMMKFIVESFQEYTIEASKFRLGIFSGDMLIRYIADSNNFLLSNDCVSLVLSPEVSSKELVSLLACICECLVNAERHDEVANLSERVEETLHHLSCDEFVEHFVRHDGVKVLLDFITAINQCKETRTELRVQLWSQVMSGLAFLITYDDLILETERGVDIIDFPFNANGLEWSNVPDDIIKQIVNCHYFLDDAQVFRNCLLVLLSFLKSCPDRVNLLLDNGIGSFLFNALEASHPKRNLPPLPQSSGKVSRSNSKLSGLTVRPITLTPPQSTSASLLSSPAPEQGKKRTRVTEMQVLAVCLVHAIYAASKDSLKETLNILPPYSIAPVVADLLMTEQDALKKSVEAIVSPQNEIRDDTAMNYNHSSTGSRSGGIFSTLKLSRNLLNAGPLTRLSRMNSTVNDSQTNQSLAPASPNQLPSPTFQQSTINFGSQKTFVDSTPICTDEKQAAALTDQMEINLRDILINLQHFIIQPYINLLNTQPNERQMHRVLRDLCRLVRPDISSSSQAPGAGGGAEVNPKVEVYRMCGFMNPHKPDDDFKIPPEMLSVVCLSSLVKQRGHLIRRILDNQSVPENLRSSSTPVFAWLRADALAGHPKFPLLPAVRSVALVLCQALEVNVKSSPEGGQLNTLLFQSSPNADSVFLELFLHCFDAFYEFWFAANAAPCDLERISKVLEISLSNAISSCPNTFGEFARALVTFSLDYIQRSWRMRDEEKEKNHRAVQELHRDLVKQHTETVTKQRLYTMSHGPPLIYMKPTKKEVQRLRVSLSSDQNLLMVRDLQNHVVEIWPLSSILSVTSQADYRKNKNREWLVVLTIDTEQAMEQDSDIMRPSMAKQQNRHNQIILIAPSEYIQTSWIDGFSCLRKEKFTSAAFADDVNRISDLDLRIRLFSLNLDTVPSTTIQPPASYPDLSGLLF
ncbi:hypothetical protein Aperf_G00000088477 [Anoplocephala perfoliata]